jgi:large subunit ribosomal protein L32
MGKKPTPKYKHSRFEGRKRYAKFQFETRRRLLDQNHLVKCSNCQEMRRTHHACMSCGFYRGRKVIDMTTKIKDKIKTISA